MLTNILIWSWLFVGGLYLLLGQVAISMTVGSSLKEKMVSIDALWPLYKDRYTKNGKFLCNWGIALLLAQLAFTVIAVLFF